MSSPDSELFRWFAEEVQPHEAALRSWLRGRFPGLQDIDDVVQESYTRLLHARETGSIACPRAFLFVTARNLALNHFRHQRHEQPDGLAEVDPSGVLDETAAIPDSVANAEDLRHLIKAIESLPARCRQIVTLRKIYGLSQNEVAARLGLSEHTVESQGSIGLHKCIEYFRRHHDSDGVRLLHVAPTIRRDQAIALRRVANRVLRVLRHWEQRNGLKPWIAFATRNSLTPSERMVRCTLRD